MQPAYDALCSARMLESNTTSYAEGFSSMFLLFDLGLGTEGDDEIYHDSGVFVLGRTHITSLYGNTVLSPGVPSLISGGSVFSLVIIF